MLVGELRCVSPSHASNLATHNILVTPLARVCATSIAVHLSLFSVGSAAFSFPHCVPLVIHVVDELLPNCRRSAIVMTTQQFAYRRPPVGQVPWHCGVCSQ